MAPTATMQLRGIVRHPDARLRRVCRAFEPDEDARDLVAALLCTMHAAGGVGLAAPQIGDMRRVLVCRHPHDRAAPPVIMVNPVIEAIKGPPAVCQEGCLSFPGLFLQIRRLSGIRVRYLDHHGRIQVLEDEGLLARIVQHEVDHLDGVLFSDHLPPWRRCMVALRLRLLARSRRGAREVPA